MTEYRVPRRTFLTAAASVAGAALTSGTWWRVADAATIPLAPTNPRGVATLAGSAVRLGVASYSFRKLPLEKTLESIKALHTPYVNFKSMHVPYEKSTAELEAWRAQIEVAGFQIVGGGTIEFNKDTDEDVKRYFEYAKAAGMPLIVCTCDVTTLPRIEKFATQYNIKVAVHNHGPEDRKRFPSPYDVLKYVKDMDPRMGLCMDIGHTVRTGTDVVKAIIDAGPRLLDMHAKDLRDLKVRDSQALASQVIVGEGALPFPEIFHALDTIRYSGFVNLEYEIDADDPLPGMKQSFAYMRGVLAGMNGASHTARASG